MLRLSKSAPRASSAGSPPTKTTAGRKKTSFAHLEPVFGTVPELRFPQSDLRGRGTRPFSRRGPALWFNAPNYRLPHSIRLCVCRAIV